VFVASPDAVRECPDPTAEITAVLIASREAMRCAQCALTDARVNGVSDEITHLTSDFLRGSPIWSLFQKVARPGLLRPDSFALTCRPCEQRGNYVTWAGPAHDGGDLRSTGSHVTAS
jgi:hypothetical protein